MMSNQLIHHTYDDFLQNFPTDYQWRTDCPYTAANTSVLVEAAKSPFSALLSRNDPLSSCHAIPPIDSIHRGNQLPDEILEVMEGIFLDLMITFQGLADNLWSTDHRLGTSVLYVYHNQLPASC